MNVAEMRAVLELIRVPEFEFKIHAESYKIWPPKLPEEESSVITKLYLQGHYTEPDVRSGIPEPQSTRKWILSEHMTKSELVQTAFKCYATSLEHQARESFTYRGRRVFGPHCDVDKLWELVGKDANLDYRRTEPAPEKYTAQEERELVRVTQMGGVDMVEPAGDWARER